jgi:hypothetical protein
MIAKKRCANNANMSDWRENGSGSTVPMGYALRKGSVNANVEPAPT